MAKSMDTKKGPAGILIPEFTTDEVPGVTFGGFTAQKFLFSDRDKLFVWGRNLSEAMIACCDLGKGWHLNTAFEWAAMAYRWKMAKTLDSDVFDMHSATWQWVMGLFMKSDGSAYVLASLDNTCLGSPYGRGVLTVSDGKAHLSVDGEGAAWPKQWLPDAFAGMEVYIAETGQLHEISHNATDGLRLRVAAGVRSGAATFCILRHVPIDITKGMSSGDRIKSLRFDQYLAPFAIPETSGREYTPAYGNDRFWFQKNAGLRAALRGGYFNSGAGAGVFALLLNTAPADANRSLGLRACKAL